MSDTKEETQPRQESPVPDPSVSAEMDTPEEEQAVQEGELEEVDVEDEEEPTGPNIGTTFHTYTPHRVVRVRDPSIDGAPLVDFNANGRYHSKTVLGACKKANNKIFDFNKFPLGKKIWLLISWKVPYESENTEPHAQDSENKEANQTTKEVDVYESFFFTRIPASKPKKLYLYDKEMTAIRAQWKSETTVVDESSSLVKLFRDSEGKLHEFTNQELKQTTEEMNPITNQMEKRGPAHNMESAGFLYCRPSSELTIQQLDGIWTRTQSGDVSTITPKESPKMPGKHHVVDFKCESLEVILDDDAIEIQRVEKAEEEYARNPPAPKPVKNKKKSEDAAKPKPRRKRILIAEEIKEMKSKKKLKENTEENVENVSQNTKTA